MKRMYFSLFASILAVAAIIVGLLLPSATYGSYDITGAQTAFGGLFRKDGDTFPFKFSFMNCLTYVFLLVGIALLLFTMTEGNRNFIFFAIGAFAAAATFFFLTVAFTQVNGAPSSIKKSFDLGIGSIIAGSCSLGATACALAAAFFDKLKKEEKKGIKKYGAAIGAIINITVLILVLGFPFCGQYTGGEWGLVCLEKIDGLNIVNVKLMYPSDSMVMDKLFRFESFAVLCVVMLSIAAFEGVDCVFNPADESDCVALQAVNFLLVGLVCGVGGAIMNFIKTDKSVTSILINSGTDFLLGVAILVAMLFFISTGKAYGAFGKKKRDKEKAMKNIFKI